MTYFPEPQPGSDGDARPLPGVHSLRASDREREAAAVALRDHCAQGRLTPDELSDRLERVDATKTVAALETLFDDLPTPPARPAGSRRRPDLRRLPRRLVALPVVTAVVALAAVTDAHLIWLAWPALAIAGRHHRFKWSLSSDARVGRIAQTYR